MEAFQIKYLPDRVPHKEFASLLRSYPLVHHFLVSKHPPILPFITQILEQGEILEDSQQREELCQDVLWEIADLIIYNKHPELFDIKTPFHWDINEISSLIAIKGKVVADVGAGSGCLAFLLAPLALSVFAVEPVTALRSFMKEKAMNSSIDNLFVLDGTLDSIPLPEHSLDMLITSNAIGWNLAGELPEIERVVKPGGMAIHLLQAEKQVENPIHETITSPPWNYSCIHYGDNNKKIKYSNVL